MSASELIEALDALDMEQIELARLLDVGPATVRRWVAGSTSAPGYVALVLRMLVARPELLVLIGARKRSGRGRPPRRRA